MSPQTTTSGSLLQGGSTTYDLQPTATTQMLQPAGPTGVTEPAPAPVQGTTTTYDPMVEQRTNLQKSIQKLVGDTMSVYDSLYGNLNTAASGQRQALESRFARETGSLGEQFTQEIPRIGQAYAARGAYDSSWRGNAEETARKGFESQLQGLGEEQRASMAKIGQEVSTQEAQFRTGQEGINRVLAQLPNVTDVNELTALQNELQKRIDDLRASQAGLQSQEAYIQRFQQLAPSSDRMAQLQSTLSRIIAGEAPGALKQSVGAQIIGSSGLTEEEKAQVLTDFNAQVSQTA